MEALAQALRDCRRRLGQHSLCMLRDFNVDIAGTATEVALARKALLAAVLEQLDLV